MVDIGKHGEHVKQENSQSHGTMDEIRSGLGEEERKLAGCEMGIELM